MHGVRVELLQQQAESIGLPLEIMQIRDPQWKSMKVMRETLTKLKKQGVTHSIFWGYLPRRSAQIP
jgi:diphthamide synthase (EF-2-diphthine--ammonia ligase)